MCPSTMVGFDREMLSKLSHCLQELRRALEEALHDQDLRERYGDVIQRVLNAVRGDVDVGS